jgi:hypothetical protein
MARSATLPVDAFTVRIWFWRQYRDCIPDLARTRRTSAVHIFASIRPIVN